MVHFKVNQHIQASSYPREDLLTFIADPQGKGKGASNRQSVVTMHARQPE